MRREEDRPPLGLEGVEDLVERPLHQRVEALRRLVEDRQLGIVLQRLDDADLLAHAARVVADEPLQRRTRQLQPVAQLAAPHRRTAGQLAEIVEQPLARERVVERDAAGQVADPATDRHAVAHDVEAEHAAAARGRMEKPEQEADRRALPGSVRTEEAEHLALTDDEIERFERSDVMAVVLREAERFDRRCRAGQGTDGRRGAEPARAYPTPPGAHPSG